ncbi:MAG TPA: hypothetical protein VFG46_19395 [Chryseolinea sp.]|nr:hypothetical protein [Chryseolinea sp.]
MIPYSDKDKKVIAFISILSGVLALGCLLMGLAATQFDQEAFANPAKLLDMPGVDVSQLRWFMLLDLFGYYLLLLPLIFFVHSKLKSKTALAPLFTSLGFGYVLVGCIGAAVLAVIWPSLLERYGMATTAMQEVYKADFLFSTDFVVKGLWNYLEVLLGGVWWLGIGYFVIHHRGLKIMTFVLGTSCLVDGFGELFQFPLMAEIGLNIYLILGIAWPVWVGITILKNKF